MIPNNQRAPNINNLYSIIGIIGVFEPIVMTIDRVEIASIIKNLWKNKLYIQYFDKNLIP
jgi:hypothetical protein